jgi:parallel beta-helix repeat protein
MAKIMFTIFLQNIIRALIILALLSLEGAVLQAATQATYYVSPTGSDSNSGVSSATAFATLEKARDTIRPLCANMTGDIVVEIAQGDYPVTETIAFTDQDSGTNGFKVIYKNHDAIGSAHFIGSTRVTGWTPYKDHIYQANIGTGLDFTTLYENGIRADLARWPKRTSPFATSRGGYMTFTDKKGETLSFLDSAISPEGNAFDTTGKDFSNAWVYAWNGGDGHRWCSATTAVTSATNTEITIKGCGLGWPPDNFLIEGSLGLLSRPGEFFYDKVSGILYYDSRFPGPIEQQQIMVPKIVRIIDVTGSTAEAFAHDLKFSGLSFLYTDRIAQSGEDDWVDKQPSSWDGAIVMKNAQNVIVENCRVADSGIDGITLSDGTQNCTVTGCLIEHVGYQGIDIIGHSQKNIVSNCLVRYCGELRGHGRGVNAISDANVLTHLEVYFTPRAGVCTGANANVSYVKVHDCVQDSGDQGAFYLCGNAGATFNQCTSFHNYCDLSNMDRPPTAVYNDRDAPNTTWSNIDAGDSQMFIFRHDPQKEGTLTFNNVCWDPTCNPRSNEIRNTPNPNFDKSKMEYDKIGLTADFPKEYQDSLAAPATPLNLWIETGNTQVTLHWTQVDHATSYAIKRATRAGGAYATVGTNPVPPTGWDTGTSYTDTGLKNGTTYFYTVTATSPAGERPASLEWSATPNEKGSNKLAGTPIGSGGDCGLAFDGNLKTYFDSPNGWAGLDLGGNYVITKIQYSPRSDNTDTTAKMRGGEFQGANDAAFTNPVTLYKVLATKGGAGTPVLIPQGIFNSTPFQYVRYVGPAGKSLVGEIEFYGYAAP